MSAELKERDLANKVSELKQISIDIGDHVRESHSLMDGMSTEMGSVGQVLQSAQRKVKHLLRSGGMNIYIYDLININCVHVLKITGKNLFE